MTSATCPWYRRWFHRRLRRIDREMLFPACLHEATARAELFTKINAADFSEAIRERVAVNALQAFDFHKQLSGQDHWHCPCARDEQLLDEVMADRWMRNAFR